MSKPEDTSVQEFEFDRYNREGVKAEYDSFYAKSDFTELSRAESATVNAFVKKVGIRKGMVGIDLPCGTGKNTAFMEKAGMSVKGIDISLEGIKVASRRFPNTKFEVGDATDLRFDKNSLDFIFCSGLSLYNDSNLDALTAYTDYLSSFLKPSGHLLFIKTTSQTDKFSKSLRMDYKLSTFNAMFRKCSLVSVEQSYCSIPQVHPIFGAFGFNPLFSVALSIAGRILGKPIRVYIALKRL